MCVAGVVYGETPSLRDLLLMEQENPHGGGVAWAGRTGVRYRKGLNAYEVHRILKRCPRPALLHFRWATHGSIVPHLTHPFPLGPRALYDRGLRGEADAVMIHNGTWGAYEAFLPKWAKGTDVSDTAVAAYVAATDENILNDVRWATAVGRFDASIPERLRVTLRGSWYDHGEARYSNLYWVSSRPAKRTSVSDWAEIDAWIEGLKGGREPADVFLPAEGDDPRWTPYAAGSAPAPRKRGVR